MARPVQADAGATRQRILGEALGLFSAHGAEGASIRQIASAAGVSVAMIHHYFGSKEGLYDACIAAMDAELAALRDPLLAALVPSPAPSSLPPSGDRARGGVPTEAALAAVIAQVARAGFRLARQHQTALRLLQREILSQGSLPAARQREVQLPFLDQVAPWLEGALHRPPGSTRLALQSLVMLTARYALSSPAELALFAPGHPHPPDAVADHLVEVALRLLALEPSP